MLGFAPEQQKATPSYGEEERDFFGNLFRFFHFRIQFKTSKDDQIFGWCSKMSPGFMVGGLVSKQCAIYRMSSKRLAGCAQKGTFPSVGTTSLRSSTMLVHQAIVLFV